MKRTRLSRYLAAFALGFSITAPLAAADEGHGVDEETIHRYELLARAVEFHGHLGPYVILGLKAGTAANDILGKDPFSVRALVKTELSPPKSCFVDGIQVSTGCSLGKRNIELEAGAGVEASFTREGRVLRLRLKPEVEDRIRNLPGRGSEALEKLGMDIFAMDYRELFDIEDER